MALLVDLENVTQFPLRDMFKAATAEGRVIVRRAYGGQQPVQSRKKELQDLAFDHRMLLTSQPGKNSADLALAIEAMDLLHEGIVDTFVLATGDADFAGLARRLRAQGKTVVGVGARNSASDVLVQSVDKFEDLAAATERKSGANQPKKSPGVAPKVRDLVREAFETAAGEADRTTGASLGNAVQRLDPAFNARDHGFASLRKLLEAMSGTFEVTDGDRDMHVRLK